MSPILLPREFGELERFADKWALATENARNQKRRSSSMAAIRGFYDAILPRMDAIIERLARFNLAELPQSEQRLLYLAFSFMEVAPAVEFYGSPDVPDAIEAERFIIHEK